MAWILAHAKNEHPSVRMQVGYRLKNNVKKAYGRSANKKTCSGSVLTLAFFTCSLQPSVQKYIKDQVLATMGDESKPVRSAVGAIISGIAMQQGGLEQWPELLPGLLRMLDSTNPREVDGAFGCLYKIAEDCPTR
jgi:hypothetical protein